MAKRSNNTKPLEMTPELQAWVDKVFEAANKGEPLPELPPEVADSPVLVAGLNKGRADLWAAAQDRLRALIPQAVEVLAQDLESDDPKSRRDAAIHVLKACGLYGADLTPKGKTTPGAVEADNRRADMFNFGF